MRRSLYLLFALLGVLTLLGVSMVAAQEDESDWSLAEAAAPYEGVTINAAFLPRPGYEAIQELVPQFEETTGINVEWDITPYDNTREQLVLDFTAGSATYDVVVTDVVWIGEFAANEWIVPFTDFIENPDLADPNLNLDGFFPVLLDGFGTWDEVIYGYPVDNYAGLMYYNQCLLEEAGFDGPPETWDALLNEYAPALTDAENGQYGYALQSARGETQSADSFMRMVWPFGGSLLADDFSPNLSAEASLAGLQFRQDLLPYMPPDVVQWNHTETVQGMARGDVAIITEWSSFYTTLVDPESSEIVDCLGVAVEPAGPERQVSALGGFSFGINSDSTPEEQAAAYLFIQWITSEEMARPYVEAGGIPARMSVYEDEELQEQFPYFEPLVASWEEYTIPEFRPRFPEWPQISEIISQYGADMMLGNITVEEGVASIEQEIDDILEPYIAGEKERIQ